MQKKLTAIRTSQEYKGLGSELTHSMKPISITNVQSLELLAKKEHVMDTKNVFEGMKTMNMEGQTVCHRFSCFMDEIIERNEVVQPWQ